MVSSCPVPVIIAGGKKTTESEALELAQKAMNEGALGVDMGRNIFQSKKPIEMIQAIRAVVSEGKDPKKTYKEFF